ncbi:hypothetical protein RB195_003719 [Necator americanus]|uniref:7TM GPCR serpentine receptor class x (Srx) domain-containing protein n=1 Tax=Necator americanus TaxID=51031 RepID=A0ABR1DQE2_NECAM
MFGVIMIIDLTTLFLLNREHSKLSKSASWSRRDLHRREIRLFIQSFADSLTYCLMLVSFHIIAPIVPPGVSIVFATTIAWQLAHAGGGVILVVFNNEIRRNFLRKWKSSSLVVTIVGTNMRSNPSLF